jgi:ATP-binding cassette, subfamily B, bacterial
MKTRAQPLLTLWPKLCAHPLIVWAAVTALLLSAAAMLTVPVAARRMIDFGLYQHDQLINRHSGTFFAVGLVLALASAGRFYAVNWLGERVVADLQGEVFSHLTTLGPAFYETTHSGEMMGRLTADTTQIRVAANVAFSQALRNLIVLVGALVMMFVTSAALSALALVVIPAIVLPLIAYGRAARRLGSIAQDRLADTSAYAADNLGAVRTMQAYGQEANVSAGFSAGVERAFLAARTQLFARAALNAIVIFLVITSIVGVVTLGSQLVSSGTMSGGRLGQFVLYATMAAAALSSLAEVWGELTRAVRAAERLTRLLMVRPEIRSPARPRHLPVPPLGTVSFKNVRFAYPTRPEVSVLNGLSFEVRRGETVALVGPSGAGKSTILNLILRFYDPQSGSVAVDDIPVADVDLHALRSRIALVPQEVALFDATIAANIRYGKPGASALEIAQSAKAVRAERFIDAMPNGYETRLGERGVTLSGGQRQRIALARAILRDAPILLLDEATNALDAESEWAVQKALERLIEKRTTLVIAHRFSTVLRASRILVLDKGTIVEEGRHAELLRRGGLYARLAELQFAMEAAQ